MSGERRRTLPSLAVSRPIGTVALWSVVVVLGGFFVTRLPLDLLPEHRLPADPRQRERPGRGAGGAGGDGHEAPRGGARDDGEPGAARDRDAGRPRRASICTSATAPTSISRCRTRRRTWTGRDRGSRSTPSRRPSSSSTRPRSRSTRSGSPRRQRGPGGVARLGRVPAAAPAAHGRRDRLGGRRGRTGARDPGHPRSGAAALLRADRVAGDRGVARREPGRRRGRRLLVELRGCGEDGGEVPLAWRTSEAVFLTVPGGPTRPAGGGRRGQDTHREQRLWVRLDGVPAVKLSIRKQPNANTVAVAERGEPAARALLATRFMPSRHRLPDDPEPGRLHSQLGSARAQRGPDGRESRDVRRAAVPRQRAQDLHHRTRHPDRGARRPS